MDRRLLWVAGAVGVWWLLRSKSAAATTAAAPATSPTGAAGGFTTLGLAELYFDPGQSYDVNANVSSPTFGNTIN